MIPFASELKEEIALRRAVEAAAVSAPSPDSAESQASVLIEQISFELEIARREPRAVRTSVDVPLNFREKHNASLNQLRQFLVARGYAVTLGTNSVNISWA